MSRRDIGEELKDIAARWGLRDIYAYNEEAFSRNLGFFDAADFDRLIHSTVAIPGLGGVGGAHVAAMARSGVGNLHITDMDAFEPVNMNRQYGAKVHRFGRSKLDVMTDEALSINPYMHVRTFPEGLNQRNMDDFLRGVDVVIDGLDFFVFDVRRALFNRAYELGIPVITAGPLGFSSALLVFTPGGMTFDEYFDITDDTPERRKYIHFTLGLAPAALHSKYLDFSSVDFNAMKGPSLNIGCLMSAGLAGTEALRLLLDRKKVKSAPYYLQFDPYRRKLRRGRLRRGNRSRLQTAKRWFLENILLEKAKRIGCEPVEAPKAVAEGARIPREAFDYLLRAAIQAPSGDNVQPWGFSVDDAAVRVFMNAEADDSFFNVRNCASWISTGAAVENMTIAASACGLAADVRYPAEGDAPDLAATIRLTPSADVREDHLAGALWRRHTDRKPLSKRPLPDGLLDHFSTVAREAGGDLHWINTPDRMKRLANALLVADRIRLERQDLHRHLMKMIRFDDKAAETKRDGFPLHNLEAGFAGELFLRLTKSWKVMRVFNLLGFSKVGSIYAAQGVLHSGAAGLLTVPAATPHDLVVGGRALERVWLTLTHFNLRLQPMTAVTLFRLRWLMEGPDVFSLRHQAMLHPVWETLESLFPQAWNNGLVMLFRTGFGKPIHHGTYRRPPESFLR